jgi:hypothetical protein
VPDETHQEPQVLDQKPRLVPQEAQVPSMEAFIALTNRVSELVVIFFFYELYFFQVAWFESLVSNMDHYPIIVGEKQ